MNAYNKLQKSSNALDMIDNLVADSFGINTEMYSILAAKGRELGLQEFKKYLVKQGYSTKERVEGIAGKIS